MSTWVVGLLLTALLIVLTLSGIAFALWRQVWARQSARVAADQDRHDLLASHLRILAGSLLDEQVPLIEGAIRIKVLLDHYDPTLGQSERCQVFQQLYEASAHVPTHADWSALDKAERRHFEALFSALELRHKAAARTGARWLLEEALPAGK